MNATSVPSVGSRELHRLLLLEIPEESRAPPGRVVELAVDGDVVVEPDRLGPLGRGAAGALLRDGGTGYQNEGQGPRACDEHGIP